ncbi:hypothetical protein SKAU_G00247320 [Synaphobranchus kaupii]|uniref:Uncharacterized protein n=1 Tax=Synaphobranchus kaupii TaxID=118154 RepID=A0A9Q1F250_SYNKA|nr:hypothetical protein SKAU_G00247320 [Synaphobranchus kaupii]
MGDRLKKKLLAVPDLTWKKAVELTLAQEPHISRVCRQKEREGNKGPQSGKRRGNWAHRVAELSPMPPEEYEDEEEEIAVVLAVRDKPPHGGRSGPEWMQGQNIKVCGSVRVMADYNGQEAQLNLLVVSGRGTNLLGRDWIKVLNLDWPGLLDNLNKVCDCTLSCILDKHVAVFRDELGQLKGTTVSIQVDPFVRPRFFRPRAVPLALQKKFEIELERLQLAGIIQPVTYSEWAAPFVPVLKGDGTIRLCGDYKLRANVASRVEQYPLPRID